MTPATCHPSRAARVRGRCQPCYAKDWAKAHPERIRSARRHWEAAHPGEVRAKIRRYFRRHPEKSREMGRRRRAWRRGNGAEPYSELAVLERDGWRCWLCRAPIEPGRVSPDPLARSIDHVIPLSRGGPDTADNVRAAHLGCNKRRGNKAQPLQEAQPS